MIVETYKQENKNSPFYLYFEEKLERGYYKKDIKDIMLSKAVAPLCKGHFSEGINLLNSVFAESFVRGYMIPFENLICSEYFEQILTILKNNPPTIEYLLSHNFKYYIHKIPTKNLKILFDLKISCDLKCPDLDYFDFLCRIGSDEEIEREFVHLLRIPDLAYNGVKQLMLTNKIHLIKKYYDDINIHKLFIVEFTELIEICEVELIERLIIDGRIEKDDIHNLYLPLALFHGHNSIIKLLSH
jgi:hypothetical protein